DHGPGCGRRLAGDGRGRFLRLDAVLRRDAEDAENVGFLGHVARVPVPHHLVGQYSGAVSIASVPLPHRSCLPPNNLPDPSIRTIQSMLVDVSWSLMPGMRDATVRQLQIFAAAATSGSFSRAALELHLTQPAVSMQMRQLEHFAGAALFERV